MLWTLAEWVQVEVKQSGERWLAAWLLIINNPIPGESSEDVLRSDIRVAVNAASLPMSVDGSQRYQWCLSLEVSPSTLSNGKAHQPGRSRGNFQTTKAQRPKSPSSSNFASLFVSSIVRLRRRVDLAPIATSQNYLNSKLSLSSSSSSLEIKWSIWRFMSKLRKIPYHVYITKY